MIDSHCHLNDERFDSDRDEVINRAREKGVSLIINIGSGYGFEGNLKSIQIARENAGYIYATVGIHPHDAKLFNNDIERKLRKLIEENRDIIVGIGEIGLDYHYNFSDPVVQQEVFRKMLYLARDYDLPVVIHSREAGDDTFRILGEGKNNLRGVMHCFSGDRDEALRYIEELGFYISISGVVTFKNALKTVEVVKAVPLEWLFAETDSPYLTPAPYRGKRNEPSFVEYVYRKIAEIKEENIENVERIIDSNINRLFSTLTSPE